MEINKIEDVSACALHGQHTRREILTANIDWNNNAITLNVVDICEHCGVAHGDTYNMEFYYGQ